MRSKYDVTTFALNIKLPSVVLLREYSLLHFLRKNHSVSAPYDLKDTLKVSELDVAAIPIRDRLTFFRRLSLRAFQKPSTTQIAQTPALLLCSLM